MVVIKKKGCDVMNLILNNKNHLSLYKYFYFHNNTIIIYRCKCYDSRLYRNATLRT
ncbi:unknown [Spodoptera litura nucleopolyhedrovirus]|uniref:Uncharacterized protein n=1 Tax=Spodoptera litura multicapsid nucleopolyhedrovirus TaxID=46242 RepID=Q91BG9_NPVST|nr:hypothetical protein [Spodoptera litura nucleopolyhedrovirus]AAL01827.1 unknown [Spodoptera litura nucleopolyhedrovirus]QHN73906.1 hypothetical protein [Spodoptera litura nucleopolyhedrovirus]